MHNYGPLSRVLHRLALGSKAIAVTSFDLDQSLASVKVDDVAQGRHVYVAGLARAGTTILMRRLYASAAFRSLTYQDMPFVLAPGLWRRLSGTGGKGQAQERAHGDGIEVDANSPEGLEEVFWRVFAGEDYIRPDCLMPHQPDQEVGQSYLTYLAAVLAAQEQGGPARYLAKNNNAILRLGFLRKTLPKALLLVPFREPLAHASSLLRQHRRFSEMQAASPFVKSYMTWLGHHEFGLDHRPFRLTASDIQARQGGPEQLPYWLGLWQDTYAWLSETMPSGVIPICYEDLCSDPLVWRRIAELAEIDPGAGAEMPFVLGRPGEERDRLAAAAQTLYEELRQRARDALDLT